MSVPEELMIVLPMPSVSTLKDPSLAVVCLDSREMANNVHVSWNTQEFDTLYCYNS